MERKKRYGIGWVVLAGLFLVTGCENQLATIRDQLTGFLLPLTPRQEYLRTAKRQNLLDSAQIAAWETAYRDALTDSLFIELPHREELRYTGDAAATATGFRLRLPAGRLLTARIDGATAGAPVFGELFAVADGRTPNPNRAEARWDTATASLQFEALDPVGEDLLLLVQSAPTDTVGTFDLVLRTDPVLTFPVAGKSDRNIQSFWGDSRSGGERQHEGNDIFAPRGTPLLAVADGRVRSTRISERGGKTVWLRDAEGRELNYYYAHLDSQLVSRGDFVERGDTVGLVGNTGNARTTPPHLHFGIYRRGARDPWNYLRRTDAEPAGRRRPLLAEVLPDSVPTRGTYYLRRQPAGDRSVILRQLESGERVTILGAAGRYYRIRTATGESGYVQWE